MGYLQDNMRVCVVCEVPAHLRCGGCGNVWYCGAKHQKSHWLEHKAACSPFKIEETPQLGKYLVAGRTLNPGDLILDEEVSVLGPPGDDDSPDLCLGCYYPTHSYSCSKCGVPLCGPRCETDSPHTQECSTLAKYKAEGDDGDAGDGSGDDGVPLCGPRCETDSPHT